MKPKISQKDQQLLESVLGKDAAAHVINATLKAGDILTIGGVEFKSLLQQEGEDVEEKATDPIAPPVEDLATKLANAESIAKTIAADHVAMVKAYGDMAEKMSKTITEMGNSNKTLESMVMLMSAKSNRFMLMVMEAMGMKSKASEDFMTELDLSLLQDVEKQVDAGEKQRKNSDVPIISKMMSMTGFGMGDDDSQDFTPRPKSNGAKPVKEGELD